MKSYSQSQPSSGLVFPCPQCKNPSQLVDNPFKPFCSERCKLIDLGAWANEDYKIGGNHGEESPMKSQLDSL